MKENRFKRTVFLLCILSLACQAGLAQGVLDSMLRSPIDAGNRHQILESLEDQFTTRIFYQDDGLDNGELNLSLLGKSLKEALDLILEGTGYTYISYRDHDIVLLPLSVIRETFSADYYRALQESTSEEVEVDEPHEEVIIVGEVKDMRPNGVAVVSGLIRTDEDQEPVIGATVSIPELNLGTITDADGAYVLEVPVGRYQLETRYVGFADRFQIIQVYSDGEVDLEMKSGAVDLQEVTVSARAADASVENVQIGVATVDLKNLRTVPALLGEADVVKNLLLNPGVSSLGEGATGFNVRGGEVDQNLILQDEGPFFNASHALGFFSTFNADLIQSVDLYKGNIPATYGGRIASVLDVEMKDGDFEQFGLKGGIGPVSGRLSAEGPIVKDKASFIAGVRSTYSDWMLRLVDVLEVQRSSSFFYDANVRFTVKPNERNTFILSGYASSDDFVYNDEYGFGYSTLMGQLAYKKIFSDRVYNKLSLSASNYFSSQKDLQGILAAEVDNGVAYLKLDEQLTYTVSPEMQIDAGFNVTYYNVEPGKQHPAGDDSNILERDLQDERGYEAALFGNIEYQFSPAFTLTAGLRGVLYQNVGPQEIYEYEDPDNPDESTISGTTTYSSGETIATYNSIEPRFSMRYRFSQASSFKAGYSRTAQFINQIFNSDSPTPNSQWQLSTRYIKPFRSHNTSAGYFHNFMNNEWETSLELYARYIDELFDYRDFAHLVMNDHLETELLSGVGRSYGMELSIKRKTGQVNGWLSYTLSRSERQVEGINRGDWYASNFDKTHNMSLILNYQPNRRNTLTINFNYSTGRPTTTPLGNYLTNDGLVVPIYSERNKFRIPDYHRLDIAYTIGKGYKKDKILQTSWTISIYNVYGRKNAFSVFFTQGRARSAQANKLAVVGAPIPSLTLNVEIL